MGQRFQPDLGVDVGGTFTDFMTRDGKSFKLLSDSKKPGAVLVEGAEHLFTGEDMGTSRLQIAHGTTAATNAILTNDLAPTAFLVTKGFRDILALGRQSRPKLYDLEPKPLFGGPERAHIIEVPERVDVSGLVLQEIDCSEVIEKALVLSKSGVESFAVCLLHSYKNPQHERVLGEALRQLGLKVTCSSELVPEFREFERFATAFTNAGLVPLMRGYVADLKEHGAKLGKAWGREEDPQFYLMQSDGGVMSLDLAQEEPVRLVLSGPAGGVVGAWHGAATKERQRLITFDMGGTSTDVALLDGGEPVVGQAELAGRPLLVPVLDIHTVGAGGGSIARRDFGGALLVGPSSAGSSPGPACYGLGGPVTVTDAHVFLGRIPKGHFLGGSFDVDHEAAERQINALGADLGLSPITCALGILEVAESTMERALRRISLERGFDPRRFSLVCFGGAGALHGASLARKLDLAEVVVPRDPGLLSAKGMLWARQKREYSASLVGVEASELLSQSSSFFFDLRQRAQLDMEASGGDLGDTQVLMFCDLRYAGQSFSMTMEVVEGESLNEKFHQAHRRQYGFDLEDTDTVIEVTTIRLRVLGQEMLAEGEPPEAIEGPALPIEYAAVVFGDSAEDVPIYQRASIGVGQGISGPALIVEYSSTVVVPPDFELTVEQGGNLVLRCKK